ncbi:Amino acid permease [Mycoplasma haemocanis str. Illinois]|uniref:Amino acid permease n=1 Tax=Mycoplasma haemocanis (strain Illinois) TaxID=1111676 RepID=H6N7U5_MYCHN|nr:amino acid permease [Mycoplasma haemocanis]AEW45717.1 Amino acid permease [Mycoplasma haemocanis str. Illinois]
MASKSTLSSSSAVFISVSSMIGAGIFMKTSALNKLSHNYLPSLVTLFCIFLFSILAFSYVLVKIIPSQSGNGGFMEWSKVNCSPRLNTAFINFIRYFYHPLSLVLFSVYGVLSLKGDEKMSTPLLIMFSLLITITVMFMNLVSFKTAYRVQLTLWTLVLIPLIALPIMGIIWPGESSSTFEKPTGLDGAGKWMIMISGLPSLLFIFDGFYNLASLKDKIQSSKQLVRSLCISFAIVTFLYLYVIIGFSVGSPGNAEYRNFVAFKGHPYLLEFFEILISLAAFMTLNSMSLSNISQLTAMDNMYDFQDIKRLRSLCFYKGKPSNPEFEHRFIHWIYLMMHTIFWFLVVGIMASLSKKFNGKGMEDVLDALADIISSFIFGILACIIIGNLVKQSKTSILFKYCAIFSGVIIVIALSYLFITYVSGAFGYEGADKFSNGLKLFIMCIFILGSLAPQFKEFLNRKFLQKRSYTLYSYDKYRGSIITFK